MVAGEPIIDYGFGVIKGPILEQLQLHLPFEFGYLTHREWYSLLMSGGVAIM
jgi:hypothetical protein